MILVFQDGTQRRQMEQELIRMERLHALGEMSAGVSHNLNNILTSVLGPAQILLRTTKDRDMRFGIEGIISAARRARDLVHHLHLSTRGVAGDPDQTVQANAVIREAMDTARPRWKDQPEARGIAVEVVTDLADVPAVRATASRLHDIFINLILNAVDAMPKGGTVTIRTRAVEGGMQITFTDTGVGMDEETRRRVFEPFFTTKVDVGSGLGMSTAYNAIAGWGGNITVDSTPGRGTTFTIRLPVWAEPVAEGGEIREGKKRQRHRSRFLIVEDDAGVCDVLSELLGAYHEVETVPNGREALERFAPGKYDVAIIDLGMPGMAGDRVLREMRAADPFLTSVLIAGWELEEGDPRLSLFDLRIQKPFDDINKVEKVMAQAVRLHARRAEARG